MVGEVPRPVRFGRAPSAWPRGWLDYDEYLQVHVRCMQRLYDEGVVQSDDLTFTERKDGRTLVEVELAGERVQCAHGVCVRVLKFMEVRDIAGYPQVRSSFYQYHAWRPRAAGRMKEQPLVRCDQAHGGTPHVHEYDSDGQEVAYEEISFDDVPRLDDFIRGAVAMAQTIDEEANSPPPISTA